MMKVIRVIFFILVVALSYYFFPQQWVQNPGMGVVLSAGIAMMLIGLEYFLSRLGTFYFLSFLISLFVAFLILFNISSPLRPRARFRGS